MSSTIATSVVVRNVLRITIELVPSGHDRGKRELARAELSNVSNLDAKSDYEIVACEHDNAPAAASAWTASGLIRNHYRLQTVWALVAKAASWAANEAEKQP